MSDFEGLLKRPHKPDWPGLIDNILRKSAPRRVYHMELFHDQEIQEAIVERFGLVKGVRLADKDQPEYRWMLSILVNRFVGFDYCCVQPRGLEFKFPRAKTADTAELAHAAGRAYVDEHVGPISSWEDFEKYRWPDPTTDYVFYPYEWFSKNTPDDMCLVSFTIHPYEELSWLFGYETLCYKLFDEPGLVQACADKLKVFYEKLIGRILQFDRVKMVWATDDMGFKNGTLMSPDDMRKYVLPTHKSLAAMSHAAGRPYLLHSCGKLAGIMDDLIDDVKIDAKHSYEDTIEDVRQVKGTYGRRVGLIGGMDVDFMCRSSQADIRKRTRETLDKCLPGGGYCLGTGNSVANYMPVDNYLAMVDEGRLYG